MNISDLQVLMLLNSKEKCIKSLIKSDNTFIKSYLDYDLNVIKINGHKENMKYYNEHILLILYEIIEEFGTKEESKKIGMN